MFGVQLGKLAHMDALGIMDCFFFLKIILWIHGNDVYFRDI